MDSQAVEQFITFCYTLANTLVDWSADVIAFLTRRLEDIDFQSPWFMDEIVEVIFDYTALGNMSLLTLVFGGGIVVYFAYQLVVWFGNLVT